MVNTYLVVPAIHRGASLSLPCKHMARLRRVLSLRASPRTAAAFLLGRLVEILAHASKEQPKIISVDPASGDIFSVPDMRPLSHRSLFRKGSIVFLANASCLLETQPPYASAISAASPSNLAIHRPGNSLLCCAGHLSWLNGHDDRAQDLRKVLMQLVTQKDASSEISWASLSGVSEVRPEGSDLSAAPSAEDFGPVAIRDNSTAPVYLNAALAELMDDTTPDVPGDCSPEHLRRVFLAMRELSSVPWIFNALVNTIEYRSGASTVDSFPTEAHIALTGACNIECTFCSYSHEIYDRNFVSPEQVVRLDFVRHLLTLRLSSGLGEPTLNPYLPQIIESLARAYPHLNLNFFTNGVALNRKGLIDAMVGNVRWINVSLNAATSSTWRDLCGRDLFARVCKNLRLLHDRKRERGVLFPIVHASMVLTARNLGELPNMPALCRSLGVDRFTGFPFAAFNAQTQDGDSDTFHQSRDDYGALYAETIQEARKHQVSIEIPLPERATQVSFGLEPRSFYDFAGIESHHNPLALLVDTLDYAKSPLPCPAIWQTASISATSKIHAAGSGKHFLYPCLGPLGSLDLSRHTKFDFPDSQAFLRLWNNPIFVKLREGQRHPGLVAVCDVCRCKDSRDPGNFRELDKLIVDWMVENAI